MAGPKEYIKEQFSKRGTVRAKLCCTSAATESWRLADGGDAQSIFGLIYVGQFLNTELNKCGFKRLCRLPCKYVSVSITCTEL